MSYVLVTCGINGCTKRHGVRAVPRGYVSPLRSGPDSDLTAGMGTGAREGASGSERSGHTLPTPPGPSAGRAQNPRAGEPGSP